MQTQETGVIKRYYRDRNFGFIRRPGCPDIFFHLNEVRSDPDDLQDGASVRFEVTTPKDRLCAINVELVDHDQAA